MFSTKIKNRGGGSFLGKDVWLIKEQVGSDVSMLEPFKDFQLTGENADRTQKRLRLKAMQCLPEITWMPRRWGYSVLWLPKTEPWGMAIH